MTALAYTRRIPPFVWLLAALLATAAAYWIGLNGPFLLDDEQNLGSIPQWLDGKLGLWTLVFERGAGSFGRPLSMASFALTSWLGGPTAFSFKLGNLVMHLLTGLALYGFLQQLLRRDPRMGQTPQRFAVIVTALWLLHPLHASTVLYAVQRMAQLATLFVLLGLWLYVVARQWLERNPESKGAIAALLLGVPALGAAGILAKENAALLLPLCAATEFFWFRARPRPWPAKFFATTYVALPLLAASGYLAVRPGLLSYAGRDFTMLERLLSQGRALCDYLWKLIAPNPPTMGIYTDDFAVSTGLLSPPTTLLALLTLLALSIGAWRVRHRLPAVAFGWCFFLVAHALEAGPIGLELYFEHRNYLPSIGILLALVALVHAGGRALAGRGLRTGTIGALLLTGALAVLAFGTHGRARVWRSDILLAESSLHAHPHSLRANAAVLSGALRVGNRPRADEAIEAIIHSPGSPRDRALGHSFRLLVECAYDGRVRLQDLDRFVDTTPMPLTRYELMAAPKLFDAMRVRPCPPLTDARMGESLSRLADRADAHGSPTAALRFQAARFLLRARQWEPALTQARLAWTPQSSPGGAQPLIEALLQTGRFEEADATWRDAMARSEASDAIEQGNLAWMQRRIEQVRRENSLRTAPASPE